MACWPRFTVNMFCSILSNNNKRCLSAVSNHILPNRYLYYGTPSAITTNADSWTWTCAGSNGALIPVPVPLINRRWCMVWLGAWVLVLAHRTGAEPKPKPEPVLIRLQPTEVLIALVHLPIQACTASLCRWWWLVCMSAWVLVLVHAELVQELNSDQNLYQSCSS